ncbi:unnamed protein product [Pylaiella littoralis]
MEPFGSPSQPSSPPSIPKPPPTLPPLALPPPASLSIMEASLSNFLGKGPSNGTPTKRPAAAINFADKYRPDVQHLQSLGLTRAMRALDSLRKHNATAEEGDELGASGRLDVNDRAGLFTLCGCQRGCRLTSDEMKTIQRVTHGMAEVFTSLELQFKALAPRMRGSDGEQADYQDQLEAFFEAAGTWLEFYGEARALASRKQSVLRLELTLSERRARGGAVGSPGRMERVPRFPAWLTTLIERYQTEHRRLLLGSADTGARGHRSVPESHAPPDSKMVVEDIAKGPTEAGAGAGAGAGEETSGETAATAGGEAAAMVSDEANVAADSSAENVTADSSDGKPSLDSLVEFSRFLSLLVESAKQEEQMPLSPATEKERAALDELLRARQVGGEKTWGDKSNSNSDDGGEGNKEEDSKILQPPPPPPPATTTTTTRRLKSPRPVGSPGSPRPLRYWARRIHQFLLSVRELRAVPERDPNRLEELMSEIRRGRGGRGKRSSLSPPLGFVPSPGIVGDGGCS